MSVIKFNCEWTKADISENVDDIIRWYTVLFDLGYIGMADVPYGNISIRCKDGFLITASGSGANRVITKEDISKVTKWAYDKNFIRCIGQKKASSESLSHAAVYDANKDVNAVIHVHTDKWELLKKSCNASSPQAKCGTAKIAYEIMKLKSPIVMGGHEGGMIFFGKDLDEVGAAIKII